ncbi:MAG TPA: hypothetical protein VHE30_05635 [Polyangiaceae bacterium]|nr:hypothetical protein [Polyangiaceae bacterium]
MKAKVVACSLLLAACTRDDPAKSTPQPASFGAPVASAAAVLPPSPAPSGSSAPIFERVEWDVPPTWRNLGVPMQGLQRAHFQALVDPASGTPPEHVDVFVVRREGLAAKTPAERVAEALGHEADSFKKVDWKKTDSRVVDGRTVPIVEIHGTMREMVPQPPDWEPALVERPKRIEISAMLPTKTFPYRVAMHGRDDLVDRCREDFFHFVESLRVKNERSE